MIEPIKILENDENSQQNIEYSMQKPLNTQNKGVR